MSVSGGCLGPRATFARAHALALLRMSSSTSAAALSQSDLENKFGDLNAEATETDLTHEWLDIKEGSLQIEPLVSSVVMLPTRMDQAVKYYTGNLYFESRDGKTMAAKTVHANTVVLDGRRQNGLLQAFCMVEVGGDKSDLYADVLHYEEAVSGEKHGHVKGKTTKAGPKVSALQFHKEATMRLDASKINRLRVRALPASTHNPCDLPPHL